MIGTWVLRSIAHRDAEDRSWAEQATLVRVPPSLPPVCPRPISPHLDQQGTPHSHPGSWARVQKRGGAVVIGRVGPMKRVYKAWPGLLLPT